MKTRPNKSGSTRNRRCTYNKVLFDSILNAIQDLILVVDKDLRVLVSNWKSPGYTGDTQDPGNLHCYEAFIHRDTPCESCHALKVFATGKFVQTEYFNPFTKRYSEIRAYPVFDDSNKVIMVAEHIRDITDSKLAEKALRDAETRYRLLFEHSPDGIVIIDPTTARPLEFNESAYQQLGYSREEFANLSIFDIEAQETSGETRSRIVKVTSEGRDDFDTRQRTKQGGIRDIHVTAQITEILGHPVYHCRWRDITEPKRVQEELRQQTDAMDAAIDGMALLNAEGEYVYINKAHAKLYGYEKARELIGKSWRILYDSDALKRFDQEIMPEFSRKGDWSGEAIGTKKNGSKFPQALSLTAMANGGLICVVRDITERKQAEEELKRTIETLRKAIGTTIQVMVSSIEARDPYTAGHQVRSADLARTIATEMGLRKEKIDGIRIAGSIHDIGKLSIPAEILSKPTKLSEIEFSLIKEHSRSGHEILKEVESPWSLAEIIYQHHERMDGSGYPRNLKGEEICIEARILAVSDVVEAMASHRPYRPALGIDAAMEEISKNRGILYDPEVADACLKLFHDRRYNFDEFEIFHPFATRNWS